MTENEIKGVTVYITLEDLAREDAIRVYATWNRKVRTRRRKGK